MKIKSHGDLLNLENNRMGDYKGLGCGWGVENGRGDNLGNSYWKSCEYSASKGLGQDRGSFSYLYLDDGSYSEDVHIIRSFK
jgi:hypothetical protein